MSKKRSNRHTAAKLPPPLSKALEPAVKDTAEMFLDLHEEVPDRGQRWDIVQNASSFLYLSGVMRVIEAQIHAPKDTSQLLQFQEGLAHSIQMITRRLVLLLEVVREGKP